MRYTKILITCKLLIIGTACSATTDDPTNFQDFVGLELPAVDAAQETALATSAEGCSASEIPAAMTEHACTHGGPRSRADVAIQAYSTEQDMSGLALNDLPLIHKPVHQYIPVKMPANSDQGTVVFLRESDFDAEGLYGIFFGPDDMSATAANAEIQISAVRASTGEEKLICVKKIECFDDSGVKIHNLQYVALVKLEGGPTDPNTKKNDSVMCITFNTKIRDLGVVVEFQPIYATVST